MLDFFAQDTWRWLAALGILLAYAAICRHLLMPVRGSAAAVTAQAGREQFWVVYASQTGQAEALARQTVQTLAADCRQIHLRRIEENWPEEIAPANHVLFVVSTYGQGSAPDHAMRFARECMTSAGNNALLGMRFGVLALGDSHYPDFCAFGRRLDAWLQACGAVPQFARIEVDRLDGKALANWQQQLSKLGGQEAATWITGTQDYISWRFIERRRLNPGSPGNAVFLVVLQPESGSMPPWQAGDLVDILIPGGDGRPRAYSIANLPGTERLELIVRQHIRKDGSMGEASGWLTATAQANARLPLKIRSNPGFHLQQDLSRPLILIGAGTGIAGLRAHLQARAQAMRQSGNPAPSRNTWLFFGERSGRHDYLCQLEIEGWKRSRVLSKVDLTFSRDDPVTPYVQHNLLAQSKEVGEWIKQGAQILICGNAQKMAPDVDKALRRMLGSKEVDLLLHAGRIRRDVY